MQINVLEYFENGALKKCRDKVAVKEAGKQITFGELELQAKNCAALILKRVSHHNFPIAVFLPKNIATVVADLGILYSANAYANLDIKSPPERLKAIVKNLGCELIITSAAYVAALKALDIPEDKLLLIDEAMKPEKAFDEKMLAARRDLVLDTDPQCIIHTSGSTGIPKGVALPHRGTIDFMDWLFATLPFDGNEITGSLSPFYFDIYTLELFLALAKGSTLVIIPENCAAFPAKLVEFLDIEKVSFIFWVPTIMVNIANQDLFATRKLAGLKRVFFAGEVFPTKHLNYWRRHLTGATFVNLYGPIETAVDCTYFIVDREFSDDEKLPIGFPCRNTDILILNDQNQPAKVDEPGELCVRGSSLGLGYWNNPERTAKAFTQNPLNIHYPELIYRTGDSVFKNARGEIMFLGRKDYQIKHMGYRIEMGEIEHAVLQVDGIQNCCVVYNQARKEITLFYESEKEIAPAQLRDRMSAFVPKYMLPTVFNWMEAMPRNPNGKIDRATLVARVA